MKLFEKIERIQNHYVANTGLKFNPIYSLRVWTRGDYVRYKEPNKMVTSHLEELWNFLILNYKKKDVFSVRGEFGSDPYDPAFTWNGIVFVKRSTYIQFGSTSILRNVDVWRSIG